MQVFPAIDLLGGAAVRLEQGRRESAKVYSRAPWEIAARFAAAGATRIHVVDLDAALTRGTDAPADNRPTLKRIVEAAGVEVETGGGVRSVEDCARLFDAGVAYVVLGTAAVKDPRMVEAACARWPGKLVIAVDAREGKVAVEGWTQATNADALDVGAAVARAGAGAVLYTDIGRDGMRGGPNLEATRRLAAHVAPCPVIASGGVARLEDLDALVPTGATAVVVGKALYEGAFTVEQAVARARALDAGGAR
ncbi:MAG TPA: 1-(5-phosphoribosyl)-5-[(5-phosphoribosylamino)methylideneamino]imidazole-4-carboxamide isomerase [Polyangia bacterium]|nr:1-(5-phosphoribosyl)-5-[(5-phosphoribosylamino)methylideneamino]imidazole-4-carboxamide isomerase [Polyangia bacterium]